MITAVADTHTIIWYLYGDNRLSTNAKNDIETAALNGEQVGVSTISLIELVFLIERSRIAVETLTLLTRKLEEDTSLFVEIPLDRHIVREAVRIPNIPELPDRLIAATALFLNVPLLTRDNVIQAANLKTIW